MPAPQAEVQRPPLDRERPARTETALLALGCFWSPDAQFGVLPGVVRTSSGYAGGAKENPTYRALGDHTETVEVASTRSRFPTKTCWPSSGKATIPRASRGSASTGRRSLH